MHLRIRLPDQFSSLRRFPVPIAIAVAFAVLLNLEVANLVTLGRVLWNQTRFALMGAFLAALIVDLWADSRSVPPAVKTVSSLIAAVATGGLLLGRLFDQSGITILALVLATMTAAHFRYGTSNESFWLFNLKLGIAVAMGGLAFQVVAGGLSLLLVSVDYLFFDFRIGGQIYQNIWATCAALIGPLFALAMMPAAVDEPVALSAEPGLVEWAAGAILNFALAPLVLAYALMLHIYAAGILATATMPKGEIGRLVLAFGIVGTAAYMVAYPWRESGSRAVRWFMASWFWLMIVPALMLVVAVWQRIGEYGVTPERYCLLLFSCWLLAMAAYLGAVRGRLDLRVIPASLALGLLFSSLGPWGATAVSVRSQLSELNRGLRRHNLLIDGRLNLAPPRLETFNKVTASDPQLLSIMKELDSLDGLNQIAPLFARIDNDPFRRGLNDEDLRRVLGFYRNAPELTLVPITFDVHKFDKMLGPLWIDQGGLTTGGAWGNDTTRVEIGGVSLAMSGKFLTVQDGARSISFDVAPAFAKGHEQMQRIEPLLVPARERTDYGTLVIYQSAPSVVPGRMEAWILLGPRSVPSD